MRKINLQKCNSWDELPEVWKVVKKVKSVDFKNEISDKNLLKIVQDYFSTDELRPAMTGAFVEKTSITVTDAHKLINLPFNSKLAEGVYRMNPKSKNTQTKMYGLMNDRFPDYRKILKVFPKTHKISVYKLRTYCQAAINGKYPNQVTNAMVFKYEGEEKVSFNGKFLIEVLDSFLLMGHDELYVSFSKGGMYLSPNQQTAKNCLENIGKYPFALIMELFLEGDSNLGARDIDFETELNAYYCFECDKIFNADGSVAKFNIDQTDTGLPYMNSDYLALANKLVPKNFTIPILENVMVKDTVLTASNLNHFLSVKDVDIEDGIYEIVNGALKNTSYELDDYPRLPEGDFKTLADFDTQELSQRVSQAIPFVGNDDLRESLNGVCFRLDEKPNLVATNAYILIRANLDGASTTENNQYLIEEPKYLSYFLNQLNDSRVKMLGTSDRLNFIGSELFYSTRLIDAKPPNYEQALDRNINTVLEFDSEALMEVLSSLKGDDLKKNIFFDFESENRDKGYFSLKLSETNYNDTKIVKDLNIKIECDIRPTGSNPSMSSIALIMSVNTGSRNLSFNIKYLKTVLAVSDNFFYFDNRKENPQFITSLSYVEPKTKKVVKQVSKSDLQATIDALQFLADSGNEDAKNTIESLKLLK